MIQNHVIPDYFYRHGLKRVFQRNHLIRIEREYGNLRSVYDDLVSTFKELTMNSHQACAVYIDQPAILAGDITITIRTQDRDVCARLDPTTPA